MKSQVVIVGGGVIGSAVAYFLRASDPTVEVVVIERDPTYARASSALSAASIRQQYSTPLSVQMSLYGIDFLRSLCIQIGQGIWFVHPHSSATASFCREQF